MQFSTHLSRLLLLLCVFLTSLHSGVASAQSAYFDVLFADCRVNETGIGSGISNNTSVNSLSAGGMILTKTNGNLTWKNIANVPKTMLVKDKYAVMLDKNAKIKLNFGSDIKVSKIYFRIPQGDIKSNYLSSTEGGNIDVKSTRCFIFTPNSVTAGSEYEFTNSSGTVMYISGISVEYESVSKELKSAILQIPNCQFKYEGSTDYGDFETGKAVVSFKNDDFSVDMGSGFPKTYTGNTVRWLEINNPEFTILSQKENIKIVGVRFRKSTDDPSHTGPIIVSETEKGYLSGFYHTQSTTVIDCYSAWSSPTMGEGVSNIAFKYLSPVIDSNNYKANMTVSEIEIVYYEEIALEKSQIPVITGGKYFAESMNATLSAPAGSKVFYTIDGTDPKFSPANEPETGTQVYSTPIPINSSLILKAVCLEEGKLVSDVATKEFVKLEKSAGVEIKGTSRFSRSMLVTMLAKRGGTIYYTIDGSAPDVKINNEGSIEVGEGTEIYTEPISLTTTTEVKSVEVENGKWASEPTVRIFTKSEESAGPVISGNTFFAQTTSVSISAGMGAAIWYTLDRSTPEVIIENDGNYTVSQNTKVYDPQKLITLDANAIVTAVALEPGKALSRPATAEFKRTDYSASPLINGTKYFEESAQVTISGGARILYAFGDADPLTAGTEYTGPITITESCVLKAVAFEQDKGESRIVSREFVKTTRTAKPVIAGETPFASSSTVTITGNGKIYYTIDGNNPNLQLDAEGNLMAGEALLYDTGNPPLLSASAIIKAQAQEPGKLPSEVATMEFRKMDQMKAPEITGMNPFAESALISINTEAMAKVYYTIDNTEPGIGSTLYTAPFEITGPTTVKAIAVADGYSPSTVVQVSFRQMEKSSLPQIEVPAVFDDEAQVKLPHTDGARVFYTLNGEPPVVVIGINGETAPGDGTMEYTAPFTIRDDCTLSVVMVENGKRVSDVKSLTIRKRPVCAQPQISGDSPFADLTHITISIPENSQVFYTTDGSDPAITVGTDGWATPADGSSTLQYTDRFLISTSCTVKAVAHRKDYRLSDIASASFVSASTSPVPVISGKTPFRSATLIELNTDDADAKIYYTLDGTEPGIMNGTLTGTTHIYTTPFSLTTPALLRAVAKTEDKKISPIVEKKFEQMAICQAPQIKGTNPFEKSSQISISSPEGSIYYTIDDSEPEVIINDADEITPAGTTRLYSEAFEINVETTVKALAISPTTRQSATVSEIFKPMDISKKPQIEVISPFGDHTMVKITAADGANIFYTIDGTTPSQTAEQKYSGEFEITRTVVIKALAIEPEKLPSGIAETIAKQMERSEKPVHLQNRYFAGQTAITLQAPEDAAIYYSLGENEPEVMLSGADNLVVGSKTFKYESPLSISESTRISAVALQTGKRCSEAAAVEYVKLDASKETIAVEGDTEFDTETSIILKTPSQGRIFYTTDGSDPRLQLTAEGSYESANPEITLQYAGPISATSSIIIKAVFVADGFAPGEVIKIDVRRRIYTMMPEIKGTSPFRDSTGIEINSEQGAEIRYTLDGSEPNATSSLYQKNFTLSAPAIVKAIAIAEGKQPSPVAIKVFEQMPREAKPEIAGESPFSKSTQIMISAAPGASIYYTLDSSDPAVSWDEGNAQPVGTTLLYDKVFKITGPTTLKAIAVSATTRASEISSRQFACLEVSATPVISAPARFGDDAKVEITAPDGAEIRYTLDGSDPTETSEKYTEPITITSSVAVRAISMESGKDMSAVAVLNMTQMERSEAPVIKGESKFVGTAEIAIEAPEGSAIYYTLNGTEPMVKIHGESTLETAEGTIKYSEPIKTDKSVIVMAVAVEPGKRAGDRATREFIAQYLTKTPRIQGTTPFRESSSVVILCDEEAEIRYTLDGSEPTAESALYKKAFTLSAPTLVKAIAMAEGKLPSTVASKEFEQMPRSDKPEIIGASVFSKSTMITLRGAEEETLFYTLDSTDPEVAWGTNNKPQAQGTTQQYTEPFEIVGTTTVKAIAVSATTRASEISSRQYVCREVSATPVISAPARFGDDAQVKITASDGAEIRYTLDGSDPTGTSEKYAKPITVTASVVVKAVSLESGKDMSETATLSMTQMERSKAPVIKGESKFVGSAEIIIEAAERHNIYYTLDGSEPEVLLHGESTLEIGKKTLKYTAPIAINKTTAIKAVAIGPGKRAGDVAEKRFTRIELTKEPFIEGTSPFTGQTEVTISAEENALIFYTLDGSDPAIESDDDYIYASGTSTLRYEAPFTISATTVVKAIAVIPGNLPSDIAEKKFTLEGKDGIESIKIDGVRLVGRRIEVPKGVRIYDLNGHRQQPGELHPGIYILVKGSTSVKILIR